MGLYIPEISAEIAPAISPRISLEILTLILLGIPLKISIRIPSEIPGGIIQDNFPGILSKVSSVIHSRIPSEILFIDSSRKFLWNSSRSINWPSSGNCGYDFSTPAVICAAISPKLLKNSHFDTLKYSTREVPEIFPENLPGVFFF